MDADLFHFDRLPEVASVRLLPFDPAFLPRLDGVPLCDAQGAIVAALDAATTLQSLIDDPPSILSAFAAALRGAIGCFARLLHTWPPSLPDEPPIRAVIGFILTRIVRESRHPHVVVHWLSHAVPLGSWQNTA
jgi:hypothetical protein